MIEETLSKFEGKPLSKYITLLTGFPLFMWGLNEFGNISVKTDYFDFINLDSNSTPQFFINLLLAIMLMHLLSSLLAPTIIRKCLDENTAKIKNREFLLIYFTIDDLLDVISAVAALLLSIILQNEGIKIDWIKNLSVVFVTCNFGYCIYTHYYYKNLKMAKEYLED